ncbi:hypothetical protein DSM112329_00200 [Paraconexibacter sp. AEG42_29]|uniref:Uncharacterized protein n=1 Tax=Paraconexibacter sp. AEG42_29 TaxID=2997339 RepID=A0AAU7AP03_9ACTN
MRWLTILITAMQLANPNIAPPPKMPRVSVPVTNIVKQVQDVRRAYPKAPPASIYNQIKLRWKYEKRVLNPARKRALQRTLWAEIRRQVTQTTQRVTPQRVKPRRGRIVIAVVGRAARALPIFRVLRYLRRGR